MKVSKRFLSIALMLVMMVSLFTVMAFASREDGTCDPGSRDVYHVNRWDQEYPAEDATCEKEGRYRLLHCSACDKWVYYDGEHWYTVDNKPSDADITIPKTDHKPEPIPDVPATCTEPGSKGGTRCSVCEKVLTEPTVVPATGHTPVEIPAVEATCTSTGLTAGEKCSVCETILTPQKETPKKAHTPEVIPAVEATCTETGLTEGSKCSVCETILTEQKVVPAKGHDKKLVLHEAKAATCAETGNKKHYKCESCGQLFLDKDGKKPTTREKVTIAIDPKNHPAMLKKHDELKATCEEDGTKAYWTCDACEKMFSNSTGTKEIKKPEVIEALGHNMVNTKKKDTNGKEIWKCTRKGCDHEEHITPGEKTYTLKVRITNSDNGTVKVDDLKVNNGDSFDVKPNEKVKFTATPKNSSYKAVWTYDGVEYDGSSYTVKMGKADATLYVKFVDDDDYTDGEYKLTVDISGSNHGTVKLNGEKVYDRDYFKLDEDEKITFKAWPEDGYKAVWTYKGDKDTDDSYTVKMGKKNATLYVEFVKKGTKIDFDNGYPTLTFDITGSKHGTVTRNNGYKVSDGDVVSIKKNDTRTFKADPDKGYVAVWTLGGETYVGNSFTMKMGSKDVTLYIEFMDEDDYRLTRLPFRDVSERDWYYDDVAYVYRNGYMDGISSTKFGGSMNTTRGQIVTILWRLTGEPRAAKKNQFKDVSSRQYYYDAISWAAEAGVVDGFDAKTFKPDANVTREQLAAILYRYAEYMYLSTRGTANLTKFSDYYEIGTWARDAMAWANYHGLINGTDYYHISPKGYATRAQIAAILHRFAVEFGA